MNEIERIRLQNVSTHNTSPYFIIQTWTLIRYVTGGGQSRSVQVKDFLVI